MSRLNRPRGFRRALFADGTRPLYPWYAPPCANRDPQSGHLRALRPIRAACWFLMVLMAVVSLAAGCKKQEQGTDSPGATSSMQGRAGAGRGKDSAANENGSPVFRDVTGDWGIDFRHETGADGQYFFPEIMAGGVALADFDGNGLLDAYFTNGNRQHGDPRNSATATTGPGKSTGPRNRLFLQTASGTMEDRTDESGLGDTGYGMGVAIGDLDNDGDRDVYVSNYGTDAIYTNLGNGRFRNITAESGIEGAGWSASVALVDINRDDRLDIFVTRYVELNELKECSDELGRRDYCSPKAFYPVHDLLYLNLGNNRFKDISQSSGIAAQAAAGLGVACGDWNDDGWIDMYVANDAYPNHLWINQKDGTFKDRALLSGCALNVHGQAEAGMGVVAADLDGDAALDLFMTHLRFESHTLYTNLGTPGHFGDQSGNAGITQPSLPFTGFGVAALDIERDGDLDLAVVHGAVVRGETRTGVRIPLPWAEYAEPNTLFINLGRGRFEASSRSADQGWHESVEVSRGLASGDIDNDGDRDLLVANLAGAPRLFINETAVASHWLGVRARLSPTGRDAIGAKVTVETRARRLVAMVDGGGSYLSASDERIIFGLGDSETVDSITVDWPDGTRESFPCQRIDTYIELIRKTGSSLP